MDKADYIFRIKRILQSNIEAREFPLFFEKETVERYTALHASNIGADQYIIDWVKDGLFTYGSYALVINFYSKEIPIGEFIFCFRENNVLCLNFPIKEQFE